MNMNANDSGTAGPVFRRGDRVRKKSGSHWQGRVVGEYATSLTPEGYAVESDTEQGSVQIYPAKALERVTPELVPEPATAEMEAEWNRFMAWMLDPKESQKTRAALLGMPKQHGDTAMKLAWRTWLAAKGVV